MNSWWTAGLVWCAKDYHRLPQTATDWLVLLHWTHKAISGWDGMGLDISLTPPTTRAPLAVLIKYQLRQQLPSGHEVMSQARLTSQIATIWKPFVQCPELPKNVATHSSSFMFRYMHLFAIHVVSKSHNACLAKLIAMQRAGVIEESQFPQTGSLLWVGEPDFFRPSSFFGPTTFWKLLVEGFCNTWETEAIQLGKWGKL